MQAFDVFRAVRNSTSENETFDIFNTSIRDYFWRKWNRKKSNEAYEHDTRKINKNVVELFCRRGRSALYFVVAVLRENYSR